MQDLLELLVKVRTEGLDSVDKLGVSVKNIAGQAKAGSGEFGEFEKRIANFTKSGLTLREALEQIAGQSKNAGGTFRQMAIDALEADKQFQTLSKNADKLTQQTERNAQRSAEAEERATERIIRTLERRAAAETASDRVQRLEQDRSFTLLGARNATQTSRINYSFDNLVKTAEARAEARAKQIVERAAASEATALQRLGTIGAGYAGGIPSFAGRGAFTAGVAGPLIAASGAAIAFGTVRSAAQDSRETVNSANRLDLSISQTRELQNEARLAGVNFGSFETATRSLSAALEDSTGTGRKAAETLNKLGIDAVTSTGEVRSMGPVLLEVIDRLSEIPDKTERAAEGNRVLGRGYKELEPLIDKHRELQGELSKYGLILDSNLISKLSESETRFAAAGIAFDNFKAKLGEKLEPIVITFATTATGLLSGRPTLLSAPGLLAGGMLDLFTGRGLRKPAAGNGDEYSPFDEPEMGDTAAHGRFGRFIGGQGDFEDKARRRASDARNDYLKAVSEGELLNKSSDKESEAYEKQTEVITKLKKAADAAEASLKALEERKGDPKAVREYIEALDEKDQNSIGKLFGRTNQFLTERPNLTRGERGDINDATRNAANSLLADTRDKLADEQDRTNNNFVRGAGQYDRRSDRMFDEIYKGLSRWDQDIVKNFEQNAKQNDEITRINRQSDREQTSAQSSRALRNIELNAGPGVAGQKQAADEAFAYRLSQAELFRQKELTAAKNTADARVESVQVEAAYKKLLWQAEDEHESKLLELQHKRQEEAEQLAGRLFDSLQKPGGFTQLVKGELNGVARQVFSNITSPIIGGIGKSISGAAPQGAAWNSVFKGTILEGGGSKDTPVIVAQDRTTAAVNLVRQTIEATATGKPLPGNGQVPAGAGGGGITPGAGGSSSPLGGLAALLGIGGLAAASINTIVNPPGFPGKKEIDTPGGITNSATVNHGYSDSAHTGAFSRILTGSVGLTGSIIAAAGRFGSRGPVFVDASGNVVGSGEGGSEGYGLPSDGSDGDFGGEVSGGSAGRVAGGPSVGSVAPSASTANTPSAASGIIAALAGGAKGGTSISNFTGNLADAISGGGPKAVAATVGSGISLGGAVATGVYTAFQQFKSGGAGGALGGVGAILGTAAAVDPEPISKAVLGAAALVTGIVKAFIPDQKTLRAQQESEALTANAYLAPPTIQSNQSLSGQNVAYDKFGMPVTTGAFSGFNVTQPYSIKSPYDGNYQTVPGSVTNITPSSASPSAAALANAGGNSSGSQINLTIHALDSQSVLDRSSDIGQAVFNELGKGGALTQRIQTTVLGS